MAIKHWFGQRLKSQPAACVVQNELLMRLCISTAATVLVISAPSEPGRAQSIPSRLTMQGPAEKSTALVLRDALGRPCLDIEAAARKRVVNPDIIDHVISIKNICPRLIKVKVCYLNSTRCNEEDLQAYKRVDSILGTMKGVSFFKYTLTQK